jgi:hypothetical protein
MLVPSCAHPLFSPVAAIRPARTGLSRKLRHSDVIVAEISQRHPSTEMSGVGWLRASHVGSQGGGGAFCSASLESISTE